MTIRVHTQVLDFHHIVVLLSNSKYSHQLPFISSITSEWCYHFERGSSCYPWTLPRAHRCGYTNMNEKYEKLYTVHADIFRCRYVAIAYFYSFFFIFYSHRFLPTKYRLYLRLDNRCTETAMTVCMLYDEHSLILQTINKSESQRRRHDKNYVLSNTNYVLNQRVLDVERASTYPLKEELHSISKDKRDYLKKKKTPGKQENVAIRYRIFSIKIMASLWRVLFFNFTKIACILQ